MTMQTSQPALYIPHGGGPCFFMDDPHGMWTSMAAYLRGLPASLAERPKAILVVSGHWETRGFSFTGADNPPLLFDYYGFPQHTYELRYDAPGDPDLAKRAAGLLLDAGFHAGVDYERGWDHGVFVPLKVAFPDADVPVVEMSLDRSLDPAMHIAAGKALAPLRDEGVLIVGSGMSFHNLRVRGPQAIASSTQWDEALTAAVTDPDPQARAARIAAWADLPNARFAHPREEHLLPLMVALGAGGDSVATRDHSSTVMGWAVSGYRFG
jgi:aromatic ring-opening dioxygenase catalytic subunit (LigB family)